MSGGLFTTVLVPNETNDRDVLATHKTIANVSAQHELLSSVCDCRATVEGEVEQAEIIAYSPYRLFLDIVARLAPSHLDVLPVQIQASRAIANLSRSVATFLIT